MEKIRLKSTIAELNGGDSICIIWRFLKKRAILSYMDLNLKYDHLVVLASDAQGIYASRVSTLSVEDPTARLVLKHFLPNSTMSYQPYWIAIGR